MRGMPFTGLTLRAALVLGFGLTLGLWLFTGYQFTRRMADLQIEAAAINERYVLAQERLTTVRTQILRGSVLVRDALLDPDPTMVDVYRRRMENAYREADEALRLYVPVLEKTPSELDRVGQLRAAIERFRAVMLDVLASDNSHWAVEAGQLLQRSVMPRRDVVIRISDEIQALNRSAFVRRQRAVADVYADSQRQVWRQLGLALAASLMIAVLASLFAGRLEKRWRVAHDRNLQNARDLQRLSAAIVRVQEEERRTIARELHDEVGQVLTAIKVELAAAQRMIDAGEPSKGLLDSARGIADGAIHTVRDLSHLLHPALLDDLGLPAAVERHVRQFGARHAIRVEFTHDGLDGRLPRETETAAYRVIQEGLTNVAKHAGTAVCRVSMMLRPGALHLVVEDEGRGFDPDASESRQGLGLIGIRERVADLHGTVRVDSAVGRGVRLTIELPVPPGADAAPDQPPFESPSAGPAPLRTRHV